MLDVCTFDGEDDEFGGVLAFDIDCEFDLEFDPEDAFDTDDGGACDTLVGGDVDVRAWLLLPLPIPDPICDAETEPDPEEDARA